MKISIYTLAKDAVRLDFHMSAMLKHHLKYVDEIVICECFSSDNTYEDILSIDSSKLKIRRERWDQKDSYLKILDNTRSECTGDWCIKLDLDEFIPEWEWHRLKTYLSNTSADIVPIKLTNFYGNYRVYHSDPIKSLWPYMKWPIHRNSDEFELWGDSSNVRKKGMDFKIGREEKVSFDVHHFGTVRQPERLREKWRTQAIRNQKCTGMYKNRKKIKAIPSFIFKLFKHNWFDSEILPYLEIYDGPLMQIVKENTDEFTRDKMKIFRYLDRSEKKVKSNG